MKKKDYSSWSKEQLVNRIKELEKRKKYGLVWDEEKGAEQFEIESKEKLPVLNEVKDKEIKNDKNMPPNILIEGDNYHALSVLNYTHKGKVDVIYIDPPYNTGSENFIYNDNRYNTVENEDPYRHSKWLAFMNLRLRLARDLLTEKGSIFISIDDNEVAQLKLLCNEIFGEGNFVAQITREAIKGGSISGHIRECHDFILVYAKDKNKISFTGLEQSGVELNLEDEKGKYAIGRELNKWGAGSRREDCPSMWFPISGPGGKAVYPIRNDGSEGRWRWGKKKLLDAVNKGDVIFEKRANGTYIVYEKIRDDSKRIKQFTTIFKDNYINAKGSESLKEIFGTSMSIFNYAKPVELIKDLILLSNIPNGGVVLDFFAGSGTTGQAVLEMNQEGNKNRKFILCTNNENSICNKITYPRIEKVIKGYKFKGRDKKTIFEKTLTFSQLKDIDSELEEIDNLIGENKNRFDKIEKFFEDNTIKIVGINNIDGVKTGLGGNLKYFKTDFVDAEPTDKNKIKLTKEATAMLCLKEDTFEHVIDKSKFKVFRNKEHYMGIIFDQRAIPEFKKAIKDIKGDFSIYIFSLGDDTFDEEFEDLKQKINLSPIPEAILRVYRRIFNKI